MNSAAPIIDITIENFATHVVDASQQGLILVDFWAPWCEPCKTLLPLLERLAMEYQGAFTLAKINVDEQQAIAAQFGVRSVPTVKLVLNGQIVDEFTGALPEGEIRVLLDRHLEAPRDELMDTAIALLHQGQTEQAESLLEQALAQNPAHHAAALTLAELKLAKDELAAAKALVDALPEDLDEAKALRNRLRFFELVKDLPAIETLQETLAGNAANTEAHYQLGAQYAAAGQFEAAMDELLTVVRQDRNYGEDAGRKLLLQIFEVLGDDPLVGTYRRRLASTLL